MGFLRVDHDPQLVAKVEDSLEIPEEGFPRGRLDKPVVEIPAHTNPHSVEDGGNRSRDSREDMRSRGGAKAQRFELEDVTLGHKA